MKKIASLLFVIFLITGITSCMVNRKSAKKFVKNFEQPVTVYSVGSFADYESVKPCYWKGTEKTDIPIGPGGLVSLSDIFVAKDGTVFTSGYYMEGRDKKLSYWYRNNRADIEDPEGTSLYFIAVSPEGTVYKASDMVYWKGTEKLDLFNSTGTSSTIKAITYAPDNRLYLAGHFTEGIKNYPCYWVENDRVEFNISSVIDSATVTTIAVSINFVVYAAGEYLEGKTKKFAYWQGTTMRQLPIPSGTDAMSINGIAIAPNRTAYITGTYLQDGIAKPCYWQAATRTDLPVPDRATAATKAITISAEGNVYTAGYYTLDEKNYLCYWKNSARVDLGIIQSNSIEKMFIVLD